MTKAQWPHHWPFPFPEGVLKNRLGSISRTTVHTLPIRHSNKGLWGGEDRATVITAREIRAYSHQRNPLPYPFHPQSKSWSCSNHRRHFYSSLRKEGVTSGRHPLGTLHFQPGSILQQHLSLQTKFQSSLELQNPMRLFNFVTSLLPKLCVCVHVCVCWGRGTSSGFHKMRMKHPSNPQPS